ncbi:MAG: Dolichyl-phosphate-mannose-protein mannosyltransferase [Elusimicrobia bacterium ADurb.Bin231]|nr:MAG: Dolichyl-phosphate-mannose-protein mannosyltransferase [Elusimicrobia bacterium ADurb.Bin231]
MGGIVLGMEITKNSKIKKYLIYIILFYALLLRLPIIFQHFSGLHAWNEGHYAMSAVNFYKYGIFNQMNDMGKDYSTTPLVPWMVYISFGLFGVTEWAARLPNLIFGIFSVYIFFFIAKKLYGENVALFSALFVSSAHGIVYFSRSLQLESPFVFFLLSGIYFAIKYQEQQKISNYILAFVFMGLSVFTKFSAIIGYFPLMVILLKDNFSKKIIKFIIASFLSLIPTLLWIFHLSVKDLFKLFGFFTRTSEWSTKELVKAIIKTPAITSEHLGIFIMIFVVFGIVFTVKNIRKNAFILVFSFIWFALLFPFPKAYLKNAYYDYPALYGFCLIAAISAAKLFERKQQVTLALVLAVIIFGCVKTYRRINKFSSFSENARIYEPSPFYSAKYVAKIRSGTETVLVDYPQTMFYAGGDPEFIKCIYGSTARYIENKNYDFIILNYFGGYDFDKAKKELEMNGYHQIAPLAWKIKDRI